MTFLELCQRVLDEGDRVRNTLTTTTVSDTMSEQEYKAVQAVKHAYKSIQQWSRHFNFAVEEGKLFNTAANGQTDYRKKGVREIFRDSIVCKGDTATSQWGLIYLTYQEWRDKFKTAVLSSGSPVWFTELPNGKFRVTPGTDKVYEIHASWVRDLDVMEEDEDEPIWDEEDHEIIVWVALSFYMTEYEVPELLAQRISIALREAKKEFLFKYLPKMEEF